MTLKFHDYYHCNQRKERRQRK